MPTLCAKCGAHISKHRNATGAAQNHRTETGHNDFHSINDHEVHGWYETRFPNVEIPDYDYYRQSAVAYRLNQDVAALTARTRANITHLPTPGSGWAGLPYHQQLQQVQYRQRKAEKEAARQQRHQEQQRHQHEQRYQEYLQSLQAYGSGASAGSSVADQAGAGPSESSKENAQAENAETGSIIIEAPSSITKSGRRETCDQCKLLGRKCDGDGVGWCSDCWYCSDGVPTHCTYSSSSADKVEAGPSSSSSEGKTEPAHSNTASSSQGKESAHSSTASSSKGKEPVHANPASSSKEKKEPVQPNIASSSKGKKKTAKPSTMYRSDIHPLSGRQPQRGKKCNLCKFLGIECDGDGLNECSNCEKMAEGPYTECDYH